jgi:hypothetical protein
MALGIKMLNSELNLDVVFGDLVLQEDCQALCQAVAGDSRYETCLIRARI